MKSGTTNNINYGNGLLTRLAAEKTKTIAAVVLILVMVFMWVKVLSKKKSPGRAEASLMAQTVEAGQQSESEMKISFVELPEMKGRTNVLAADFFNARGWKGFSKTAGAKNSRKFQEVNVTSPDGNKKHINRITQRLELQAIGLGENPQAFINNKLLSVGEKIFIADGGNTHECKVTQIKQNTVTIKCGDAKITLKLIEPIEIGD